MFLSIRRLPVLILLVLSLTSVHARGTGDGAPDGASTEAIVLMDHFDRTVTLEAPAMRVVSLAPGITETVFALGYGDRLVGRTTWCDYPAEAADVPAVGSLQEPDIEAIIAAEPDLVIGSSHFTSEALSMLENAGLNVAVFMGPDAVEGVYDGVVRPVAAVFGDEEAGEALVDTIESSLDKAEEAASSLGKNPSVYYVVGFGEGGDWTAGGDTFIGALIERAGGRNIAADVKGWAFSAEALVEADPDLILIPAWADGMFQATEPYSSLRAVGNGDVVVIDENAIVRQGPRIGDGFASLVDAIGSVE